MTHRLSAVRTVNSGLYAAGEGAEIKSSSSNLSLLRHQRQTATVVSPPHPQLAVNPMYAPPAISPAPAIHPDFRPASFFTTQMTAFKSWLRTANEQHQTATQLPILLQVSRVIFSPDKDVNPSCLIKCLSACTYVY